jgi:hypothetical protein
MIHEEGGQDTLPVQFTISETIAERDYKEEPKSSFYEPN